MSISKSAGTNLKWRGEKWFWPLKEKKGWPLPPPQEEFPPNNGFKPSEEQATNRGPSSRSGLGQGPFSDAGRRPLLTSWLGPPSGLLLGFSTSTRRPDSTHGPSDKPPRVYLPQPLLARPLSGPRGCPSAGNLPLAPLLSQPDASILRWEPETEGKAARASAAKRTLVPSSHRSHRSQICPGRRRKRPPQPRRARCGVRELASTTHAHARRETQSPAEDQHASLEKSSPESLTALARQEDGKRRGLGRSHLGSGADRALQRLVTSWSGFLSHWSDTGSITDPIFQIRGPINGGARICTQHPCSRNCVLNCCLQKYCLIVLGVAQSTLKGPVF